MFVQQLLSYFKSDKLLERCLFSELSACDVLIILQLFLFVFVFVMEHFRTLKQFVLSLESYFCPSQI